MTKTRQENDVIDCIGQIYAKTKIKLLGPIWLGVVYDKTKQDNDNIGRLGLV